MRTRIRRAAVLATAAGLLAVLPGSIGTAQAATVRPAAAPKQVGTLFVGAAGIPRSLKRGQTINLVMWYRQNSRYPLDVLGSSIVAFTRSAPGFRENRGVTVTWQSPLTHKWVQSTDIESNGTYDWVVPDSGPMVKVPPNYWAHIDVRIAFSAAAYTGTWELFAEPVGGYSLLDKNGSPDIYGTLGVTGGVGGFWPEYKFTLNR